MIPRSEALHITRLIIQFLSMSLGYVHEIISDGQVVYVDDMNAVYCQVNNQLLDSNGTFASA